MPPFFLPPIPLVKESQHPLGGSSSVINVSVSPVTLDLLGDFAVLFQAPLGGLKKILFWIFLFSIDIYIYYRVINLRMPKSKPLLSHYLFSEHVFILGAFNQFSAYILIFEIGFLIFQNLIFGPKW